MSCYRPGEKCYEFNCGNNENGTCHARSPLAESIEETKHQIKNDLLDELFQLVKHYTIDDYIKIRDMEYIIDLLRNN